MYLPSQTRHEIIKNVNRLPNELDNALVFNIERLSVLFRRELGTLLAPYNLSPEQWQILSVLMISDKESLNQTDITYLTLKDKPNVSRMIQRLEEGGWLERKDDPEDARAFLVQLSAKGNRYKREIAKKLDDNLAEQLSGLSVKERSQLLELLKKLRHLFEG
jgi:DNA-binding MarR family transcriptional regulator